jgi:general nucleoside transport system permease protein
MERIKRLSPVLTPIALAFAVAVVLLLLAGANPFEAFELIFRGSLGSKGKLANTLLAWVPLVLAAAGLVITFQAGLWNIGVEGQVVLGAIAAAFVAREVPGPGWLVITIAIAAGFVGGMVWGLMAGALKVYGKVNEIFGGLGLDFVATGLVVYLVIGPWKRQGVASTSGTDLFRTDLWLPEVSDFSVVALFVAIVAVIAVYFLMRGTLFGLRLKAVGRNPKSAYLMGINTNRYVLMAMGLGGALAGLAGAIQALAFHHKLVPSISGGYGFLGILVVMLAAYRAVWIAPIALFFVAISVGSTQLSLRLGLDSSLGGVLQGVLVLFALLASGGQVYRSRMRAAATVEAEA